MIRQFLPTLHSATQCRPTAGIAAVVALFGLAGVNWFVRGVLSALGIGYSAFGYKAFGNEPSGICTDLIRKSITGERLIIAIQKRQNPDRLTKSGTYRHISIPT